jgi:hypothetical protein
MTGFWRNIFITIIEELTRTYISRDKIVYENEDFLNMNYERESIALLLLRLQAS